ncbi:MAG: HSP20 family protein [Parasphingorhabdus sp.]|jgi:HSP20 family protein
MNQIIRRTNRRPGWEMFGEFDNLVNHYFRGNVAPGSETESALLPAIDVSESEQTYTVRAELPGINKDGLNVSINDGVLTITAESRREHEDKEKERFIRQERRYGKFTRSIRLGADVDESKVAADYFDGILTLILPKAELAKTKKIDVKIN